MIKEKVKQESLVDAKKFLRKNYKDGCTCPACGQFVKAYKRSITSAMAVGLILLYKYSADFVHIENFFKSKNDLPSSIRGDISKLCHWGLLEKKPGNREDGSTRNGYYRVTHKGELFVSGHIHVEKYAVLYNQRLLEVEGDYITIKDALGNKFNYEKLMSAT
jgi:hypothetical protein